MRWPLLPVPPSKTQSWDVTTFCMVSSFKEREHHAPKGGCAPRYGKKTRRSEASGPRQKEKGPRSFRTTGLCSVTPAKHMQRARLDVTWRPPCGEHRSTLYRRTSVLQDRSCDQVSAKRDSARQLCYVGRSRLLTPKPEALELHVLMARDEPT